MKRLRPATQSMVLRVFAIAIALLAAGGALLVRVRHKGR